ncbi:MAG: hypothetical protein DRP47_06075, partial [Candidatus Zixiibacteriota bacterium]
MTRKISSLLILSLLMFAFLAMTASASKYPVQERRVVDQRSVNSTVYAFPNEHNFTVGAATKDSESNQSLGGFAPTASPGLIIGDTWYDYQHNGSMGRMIESKDIGSDWGVHMGWMFLPGPALESRKYKYYGYDLGLETGYGPKSLQTDDDYGGYVGIAVTGDNRGVVGGHNIEPGDGKVDPQFYWDYSSFGLTFSANDQVPRAVVEIGGYSGEECIWPTFRWVEPATGDPILHVFAQTSEEEAADPQAIKYFRRVGTDIDPAAYWDAAATVVVDTVFDISQDIAATDDGRVALVWTANLPCSPGGPSSTADCDPPRIVQWDNDVWYMVSENYGVAGSWGAKTNITNYATDEANNPYRPYTDLNVLMDDDDGELHIVWAASGGWVGGFTSPDYGSNTIGPGRLFHWSENNPYLRVVHAFDWDQTTCHSGAWNITASKLTISKCRGKHYVLFSQFNDIPGGVEDDCADEGNPGYPYGSANGDLWVVVSADGGLTWDKARNITNSYTPGCDSVLGTGGPCDNDMWASMSRFGIAKGDITDPAQQFVYPSGGAGNGTHEGNYLDIQYINDKSAGGIVQSEGTWQNNDVMWVRMACEDEVPNPLLGYVPNKVAWPSWTKHGRIDTVEITMENLGNANLSFTSINVIENTQVGDRLWLHHDLPLDDLPSGLGNTRTGHIYINMELDTISYSPVVVDTIGFINDPGTIVLLEGAIEFVTNAPTSPDEFPISLIVADTVYPVTSDTISTTCLSLGVNNDFEMGEDGADYLGMGYPDDCDTTARSYMYSGSPVIGYKNGAHARMNWSAFDPGYSDSIGFVQIGNPVSQIEGNYETFDAKALALDSGLIVEMKLFAPQDAEDCNFIIERLTVYDNPDKDGAN